jgi:hypothetical protein
MVFITVITTFIHNLLNASLLYRLKVLAIDLEYFLQLLIYRKTFNYSYIGYKKYEGADLIGLIQIDTGNMKFIGSKIINFIQIFIEIIGGLSLLIWFIGTAFLSGLIIVIIVSIVAVFISSYGSQATEESN